MTISHNESNRRFYTVEEFAELFRMPVSSVRWLCQVGKIRSLKPARRRLIPAEFVEEFARQGQGR